MNHAIGESITFAVGVALSPFPIVAVIVMLLSKRSGPNATAFVFGWIAGVALALVAVLAISAAIGLSTGGSNTTNGTSTLRLVLGIVLAVMGLRRIRRGRDEGEAPPPKWLGRIEGISPGYALGLGFVLAAINPKNLILIIGGGTAIAQTGASLGQKSVAAVIFVVLASASVIAPVLLYHVTRRRAEPILAKWRDALEHHASATVGAVILILGVLLIGKGVGAF
jgi:threonine/homoserine/homoserine lactone efflux protein